MRPLLTIMLVALIMMLVGSFQRFQEQVRQMHRPAVAERVSAELPVTLRVVATCELQSDGFQVREPYSAEASLDGGRWRRLRTESLPAGKAWETVIDRGLLLGLNELFVRLVPVPDRDRPAAAKVSITQGNHHLGELLLFADQPGVPLSGVLSFEVQDSPIDASQHGLAAPPKWDALAGRQVERDLPK